MTREGLPQRRYNESMELLHSGTSYDMQVGAYPDGRVGEVFLQVEKAAGSQIDVMARDIAILISMAIQYGTPIQRMLDAITRDEKGRPEGLAGAVLEQLLTWGPKPDGWGAATWHEVLQQPSPEKEVVVVQVNPLPPGPDRIKGELVSVDGGTARNFGFTGDKCDHCQNFTMVRNGTCLKCTTCGTTTGCS